MTQLISTTRYRTIITTRIVDEDHMTLCKLPTDFRVLVRPQVLRKKGKVTGQKKQKLKSRWEIASPIRGFVNPVKLAFDHFPFRYLHDQQYIQKKSHNAGSQPGSPIKESSPIKALSNESPTKEVEEVVCVPCEDSGAPK